MVFLGDSITEQRIHTRYVMNYFALRYPDAKITFRNAGWGGDTAMGALRRLERDVLSLKPDVVSICFGMNDACCGAFDKAAYARYINSMTDLVRTIRAAGARVVLLTPGCVDPDQKSWVPVEKLSIYNPTLSRFAQGTKLLAEREHVPVYDINKLMMDVQDRAKRDDPAFTMIPDSVHPSWPGQALMAYGLLKALGCDEQASSLTIDAARRRVSCDRCKVTGLKASADSVTFSRTDNALPTWFDPQAEAIFRYCPIVDELNLYTFRVTGLQAGKWSLSVEGTSVGEFTADELAAGVNLARYPGPWRKLGEDVNKLCFEQERLYFTRWREVQLAETPPDKEAERQAKLSELDRQIAEKEQTRYSAVASRAWLWTLSRTR